jgi:hypothetical protein
MANIKMQFRFSHLLILTVAFLSQGCWLMGVCLNEELCDRYGTAKNGSSSGGCTNSALVGTWDDDGIYLSFESDCDLTGWCNVKGEHSKSTSSDSGTVQLTVDSSLSTNADCPDPGTYTCDYEIGTDGKLDLDCPDSFQEDLTDADKS